MLCREIVPADRIGLDLPVPEIQILAPDLRLQAVSGGFEASTDLFAVVGVHNAIPVVHEPIHESRFQMAEQEAVTGASLLEPPHERFLE